MVELPHETIRVCGPYGRANDKPVDRKDKSENQRDQQGCNRKLKEINLLNHLFALPAQLYAITWQDMPFEDVNPQEIC